MPLPLPPSPCPQDPYAVLKVGGQTFRTKTHTDGGKNPVWNETFAVNVINDNTADLTLYDSDVGKDDVIGTATVGLAKVRARVCGRVCVCACGGRDGLRGVCVGRRRRRRGGEERDSTLGSHMALRSELILSPTACRPPS